MRKLSTESERLDRITQWESSGLSKPEWCKAQGLSLHTFRKWVRNHHKSELTRQATVSAFIPLTGVVKETEVASSLELTYPNGVQLRTSAEITINQLKTFIHLYDQ